MTAVNGNRSENRLSTAATSAAAVSELPPSSKKF